MNYLSLYKVKWKKVLEIEEYIYSKMTWKERKKALRDSLDFLFFHRPAIPGKQMITDFLFVKVMQRSDYNKLFNQIYSTCCKKKFSLNITYTKSQRIRLYPLYILIKYFPLLISKIKLDPIKSLYIIYKMIQYLEVYEKLNHRISYKYLVVFSDMQAIENLLVQMAKLKDIKTVTLQHGLYIDYTKMENINCVNYKNHVSDFFLAWGNSTKDLIEKFNPYSKVVICGKPIETKNIQSQKSNYFTILFDQNLLKQYNHKLLQIAYNLHEKTKLKVNIRFHPHNRKSAYKIKKDIVYIDKELESSVFILGHTTSLIHELLRIGIPVFKLNSDVPALDIPETLTFSNYNDVENILKHNDLQKHNFVENGQEFISFISEESLNKYKEFFIKLSENRI